MRPGGDFSHLHVRGGFSYGFGAALPEELCEAAAAMGYESLALTDRDGLYGIPRFLKAAEEHGLSPIVGAEVSMEDGTPAGGHVVLLAESMAGYRSLCRLITSYRGRSAGGSAASRRNPRCTLEELAEHNRGLLCLTGAVPFGFLARRALGDAEARKKGRGELALLKEAFGERLYAELTDDGTAGSRRRMRVVESFARECGLPALAAHEVTYLSPAGHRLHEVLVAASNLTALPGPGYRPTDRLYLLPPARARRFFEDRREALANARAVAERCAGAVELSGEVHVPAAVVPDGEESARRLVALAAAGARRRYRAKNGVGRGEIRTRLRRELSCIAALGFVDYFLIAHEAKEIAREKGIPVTGRGSAANSLVSYCLGLTQPEPFSNRLLFERFMHEVRRDPPDIDLDFCSVRRDEVRLEMIRRYRRNGVAEAATVQTMSLRGAVRIAARALGHAPREIDALCSGVPTRFRDRERTYTGLEGWEEALREPAMRGHPLQDTQRHRLLLEVSAGLVGRNREAGTHNGGMVFGTATRHLSELVPLEPSGTEGITRCQYDKDALEYAGIPKLDLLGLRMHTALHEAGRLATERVGREIDPYDLPPGDRETYALIRTGRNAGTFQLESPGQMHLSRRLKPRRFTDLVAQISLFRPGPVRGDLVTPYVLRRNGEEPYSVPLPELEEVLRPTYGVLIFQEQVLAVANRVAGVTLAEGDLLRRAMTKDRGPGAMRRLAEGFVRRAVSRGVPEATARQVFSWMEGFAAYGFSAAHAASFAELSYASAYMKRHYPAEFFCGLLNAQPMGFYSPRTLVNEARREGIEILPPDVLLSGEGFTVEEDGAAIRVGLKYSKGLSQKALDSILGEREKRAFSSSADLYRRTAVARDALGMLVRGGFLDGLSPTGDAAGRGALISEIGRLPKKPSGRQRQEELPLAHPARPRRLEDYEVRGPGFLPLPAEQREKMEWEALSLNVFRHPLAPYREALEALGVVRSDRILAARHGRRVRAAGLLESLQRPPTRSGRPVYFLLIEDEGGLLQCTIFEKTYRRCGHVLHGSGAFLLEGRVEVDRRRGHSFVVDGIFDLAEALSGERVPEPRAGRSSRPGRRAG
jgi:DNA-directed DNA polymerase III PolC